MKSWKFENLMEIWYEELYEADYDEMEENRLYEEEKKSEWWKNMNSETTRKMEWRFALDHKCYFNKRSWELIRKQKPIILHKFKWNKLLKVLNGENSIKTEELGSNIHIGNII
jgi:hypothetical protein